MNQILKVFTLFLLCFLTFSFAYSQDNSTKKEKSKDKKLEQKPIEVKANVMVLNAENKFVNDIKAEDLKVFEDGVEQKITYFAKKENVLNLGLVVDNSGSMREQLDEITMAASTIVANLRSNDEAFLVRFVNSDKIEILQDWTSDKQLLKESINDMFIEAGQSAVIDAIYLAVEKMRKREKKDTAKRYSILLISDGEERDSYHGLKELLALFKKTDIQVFVLSYAENSEKKLQESLGLSNFVALETGGTTYVLSKNRTKDEVINALKAIVTEMRSQYVVGYISTNSKRDGMARKLTVQITDGTNGEKRQAEIRSGFAVPIMK